MKYSGDGCNLNKVNIEILKNKNIYTHNLTLDKIKLVSNVSFVVFLFWKISFYKEIHYFPNIQKLFVCLFVFALFCFVFTAESTVEIFF